MQIKRFSKSSIVISNTAQYGGSSIFGQLDKRYFKKLVQDGFKKENDESFKLCNIKQGKEGLIIADFNITYKGIQKVNPIDPDTTILSVKHIGILEFN